MSVVDTRPSGHRATVRDRPRFRKQQRTADTAAASSRQPPGHRRRAAVSTAAAAACGRNAADPQPPFRHHSSAAQVALARLRWSRRPGRHAADGDRLSGRADTGGDLPDIGSPHAPGTADTRDRRRACGHCGSGHAGQPAPEASTTAAMSERNGTAMCGIGQHPCLTARSVAWCSASTAVMVSAVCAAQIQSESSRSPNVSSGDDWWAATRTTTSATELGVFRPQRRWRPLGQRACSGWRWMSWLIVD